MTALPMPIGRPSLRREVRENLILAGPLAAAQLAQMVMAVTDAIWMGRLGTDSLAAGSLGTSVAMLMIVMAQGVLQSIQPIIAQGRGARDRSGFGRVVAGGFLVATLCAVPLVALLTQIDHLLIAIHEPADIAHLTLIYETAFAWGIPAALWQGVLRNYLIALGRTRVIMIVSACACVLNFGLNWSLIFGHLGMPALGLAGSGYATSLVWTGMYGALCLYAWRANLLPADLFRLTWARIREGCREVVVLGVPIAGIWALEVGMFVGSSLIVGTYGPVYLAANQICTNVCALTFMVPMAIGTAATVRVGVHIGAGQPIAARVAGLAAIGMGACFMSFAALGIWLFSHSIFWLYLSPTDPTLPDVVAIGTSLFAVAAIFQVFDGVQTVAAGALRGLKDTRTPLLACIFGYWILGMPVGIGLAFVAGWGPVGLWWGFVASLSAVAVLLSWRFRHHVNGMIAARLVPLG